jgi:cytochrome c oxidase subunit 1
MFAGFYFWAPKAFGRKLDDRLGRIHFWSWMVGFTLTFLPMYQLGADGMVRRIGDYPASSGWGGLNLVSTIGAALLFLGTLPFALALVRAWRAPVDHAPDPWGGGNSLEWFTESPPPEHNFRTLPPIRSSRPTWDWNIAHASSPPAAPPAAPGAPAPDVGDA